jgi:mono/diheme cytochrome c family protein
MKQPMTGGVRIPIIQLLASGAVLLMLCGDSRVPAQEKAPAPAPTTQSQSAEEAAKAAQVIPTEEKSRKNPISPTQDSIESGKNLYSSQCAMCHAPTGDGKGELSQKLKMKVPDFTNAGAMKKRTDGELHYILKKGHGEMPPETRIEEKELWDMINYIRSLARTKS